MTRAGGDADVDTGATGTVIAVVLRPRPEDVAVARHAVADFLVGRGVPSVVVDDMQLVTSELVTNAIQHGRPGPVDLAVGISDEIEIKVINTGPADAIPPIEEWRPASPLALSGRGLGIVRRLCDEVEVRGNERTAVVICRRRLPDGGGGGGLL